MRSGSISPDRKKLRSDDPEYLIVKRRRFGKVTRQVAQSVQDCTGTKPRMLDQLLCHVCRVNDQRPLATIRDALANVSQKDIVQLCHLCARTGS